MKNSFFSYRFTATFLLLITLGIGNMWGWGTISLNGDFFGNWGTDGNGEATYNINYSLGEEGAHTFLPFYTSEGTKYWRLYHSGDGGTYLLSPATDNYELNYGSHYQVKGNGKQNFVTEVKAGVISVHSDQNGTSYASGSYTEPAVWLERPTIYIWHNWNGNTESWGNNGGSGQKSMTDNEDGTYSYDGNYSGSSTGTNVGIEGSAAIKKYFADDAATKYGTLTAGDLCRFVWDADGYVGYDGETDHRGALSIYKLYTITYHTDGSASGSAPTDATYYPHGSNAPVLDNTGLLQAGHDSIFAGWATTAERATTGTVDYDPAAGDEITSISADMNLYPVWKTGYYFISLAGYDNNATLNTTDFTTLKSIINEKRRTVNEVTFSKSVFRLSKTPNDGDVEQTFAGTNLAAGKSFFYYDTKTTQTDISIYVFNDSTDAIPVYYRVLKEGSIQDVVAVDIPANSGKVVKIPTISHSKGTRVLFGTGIRNGSGYGKINFTQVKAIETGTAVLQAGQAGFELAIPGRFTASKNGASSIDGLTAIPNDNVHVISGSKNTIPLTGAQDVEATQYISFTTSGPVQLQITPKASQDRVTFYVKRGSRTFTSSDTPYGQRNTTTSVNLPESGTWYILSGEHASTKDILISKIAFVAAARITYNANGGSGSMSPTTCAAAENAFTAPTGYTFTGWNTASDGSGTPFAPGDDLFADAELFAQWEANFVIYRDGDRTGCTIPAADPVESYDGGTISQTIEYRMKVRALDQWYTLCLPFTVSAVQVWDDTDNAYYDLVPYYRTGGAFYTGHYIIRTPSAVTNLPIANFADWTDPESSTDYLPAKNTPYIIQWHDSYFLNKYICFFGERGQTIPTSMTTGTAPSSENVLNIHVNDAMKSGTITDAYLLDPEYGNGAWLREDIGTNRTIKPFECYILAASATKALYRIIRRDMTIVDTPTGFPTVTDTPLPVTAKVLIDGQLFIIREGKRYTIQGTLVK